MLPLLGFHCLRMLFGFYVVSITIVVCSNVDPFYVINSHDYCGKLDLPVYKPRGNIDPFLVRLSSVHVLMRHGARSDHEAFSGCFALGERTRYKCEGRSLFTLASPSFEGRFHVLSKKYEGGQCSLGQLLDQATSQLVRLGEYLKSTYPTNFACDNENKIYLYATDTQRTFATLGTVLSVLFPARFYGKNFDVHTKDHGLDAFAMNNPTCSYFAKNRANFQTSSSYIDFLATPQFLKCATIWKSVFKTKLDIWHAADCLLSPTCAQVSLPNNIAVPPALFKCVMDLTSEIRDHEYGQRKSSEYYPIGKKLCDLNTFKVFRELQRDHVGGIYALHDETLVCLLTSLGIWDGKWPKYASIIAFEFYTDNKIRVMRDGIEIATITGGLRVENIPTIAEYERLCAE